MFMQRGQRSYKLYLDVSNLHSLSVLLLSEFLVLLSSSFLLFSQLISLNLFSLHSVDSFAQNSLVLILVTLGGKVEVVMAIKRGYLLFASLNQVITYACRFSFGLYIFWAIFSRLFVFWSREPFGGFWLPWYPFSYRDQCVCLFIHFKHPVRVFSMLTFSLGEIVGSCSSSRVDGDVSSDDETILDELSDAHS